MARTLKTKARPSWCLVTMDITWQKETLRLLPEKAIHWPAENFSSLILISAKSDLPYGASRYPMKTPRMIAENFCHFASRPKQKIVFLGDFLHARQGK